MTEFNKNGSCLAHKYGDNMSQFILKLKDAEAEIERESNQL